jgi:two-component system chemotaxis sensor kinase CheA
LLPLVRLADVLGMERQFADPVTGERVPDRRQAIADRRSPEFDESQPPALSNDDRRGGADRDRLRG